LSKGEEWLVVKVGTPRHELAKMEVKVEMTEEMISKLSADQHEIVA